MKKLLNPLHPKEHSFQHSRSNIITHNIMLDALLLSSRIPISVVGEALFVIVHPHLL